MSEVTKFTARLEPFLLMGKSAKGAAAAKLVQDATAAPGVFVFGELLELDGVKDLQNNESHSNAHRLLNLFAYGTYTDYLANKSTLPALNASQTLKLKHLSLVSLASQTRLLSYATLQRQLDVPTIRELEDLIIDAIYQDLLVGKLDQRHQRLEVKSVVGRDVPASQLQNMLDALTECGVISALDKKIQEVASGAEASKLAQEEHEKRRDQILLDLINTKAAKKAGGGISLMGMGGGRGDYMDIDDEPTNSSGGGFLGLGWGGKKNARPAAGSQNVPEKQGARKRNRF
ncbi:hypothetical protein BKA62DRAFT_828687 [Auriculariales sp. MPI-PUGE-AT-0066]|nr:hypothetical protein BKA62DRAFT_828687 [Auriculariales sp. MPI-PUGE-AT-0066]